MVEVKKEIRYRLFALSIFYILQGQSCEAMPEKNNDIYLAIAECGFVDLSHLNRHFKKVDDITASEYKSNFN